VSHPDSNAPVNRTPIRVGEVWENPVTRETILELAHQKSERRALAELTALVGAEVIGPNTGIRG
jgi:hypothetical protein